MSKLESLDGRCLCGAVSFTATGVDPDHHACHCEMCRRWGGGPFFGMHCDAVQFEGEQSISRFASSDWAERGFCTSCGSNLFYFLKLDGHYSMCAGLFDDQSAFRLSSEIFIDHKPAGYAFAGDQPTMTEKDVFEKFAANQG